MQATTSQMSSWVQFSVTKPWLLRCQYHDCKPIWSLCWSGFRNSFGHGQPYCAVPWHFGEAWFFLTHHAICDLHPFGSLHLFFSLSRWPAGKSSNTAVPSMLGWAFIWVWINGQKGCLDPWKNKAWERSMVFWFLGANRPCQTCYAATH